MDVFRYFTIARMESQKSEYYQKIGAVIVSGNRVLSKGYNQLRHCKIGKRFSPWDESIHAERDACRKVNKDKIKGSYIFIYRENQTTGNPALAKPCEDCMNLIKYLGFKRVYYTINKPPYYVELRL